MLEQILLDLEANESTIEQLLAAIEQYEVELEHGVFGGERAIEIDYTYVVTAINQTTSKAEFLASAFILSINE